jgi:hypothetical protein
MDETLESSIIRHLILKAKLTGGGSGSNFQISEIVRTVVDIAVQRGLVSVAPRLEYQNPLTDKITAVIWELIIEGVYTPGAGMQTPNLPFLRVTEYGQKCFEAGELTAHDPAIICTGSKQRLRALTTLRFCIPAKHSTHFEKSRV